MVGCATVRNRAGLSLLDGRQRVHSHRNKLPRVRVPSVPGTSHYASAELDGSAVRPLDLSDGATLGRLSGDAEIRPSMGQSGNGCSPRRSGYRAWLRTEVHRFGLLAFSQAQMEQSPREVRTALRIRSFGWGPSSLDLLWLTTRRGFSLLSLRRKS